MLIIQEQMLFILECYLQCFCPQQDNQLHAKIISILNNNKIKYNIKQI